MASSSTPSIPENFRFHVFLSFRGEDTRTTFVDHLYASLKRLGIHTFRDNEELEKGKRIDELFKAIEESKFFIIVFSQDYASSTWCLKELAKIMVCQDTIDRIAYPLFYDVEPTDIRKQSGPVGKGIAKHKTDKQIIKTWKKALTDAGNLVGWDIKKIANGHEAEAIEQIVKRISLKLRSVHLRKDENLVGMESRMKVLESSLGKGFDNDVRMIGIKGMGGIGKTTLARTIFQKISSQFEGKSFVDDVRETSKGRGGLLSMQKQVLKDVLRDDSVSSVQDAISMMEDRMPMKKVLLVLDDVNHIDQLQALAGAWFKGGSRVIVTTRDEQVLNAHGMNIININLLSNKEALSLFCRYAFKTYIPVEGYVDLSFKVVKYAAGLPLTLKVLGSSLFGKKEPYWIDAIKRLKRIPSKEILDKLKISYDCLEKDHKEMFQDVACFMEGMPKEVALRMLEIRGFYAIAGLTVLEDRSLITISNGNLGMHDSLRELGRIIVRGSPPHELELKNHSRLWKHVEIEALLCDDEVTEATTTCIIVRSVDLNSEIIMKGLGKLKNLTFLQISGNDESFLPDNWMFDQGSFPNALRFLKWQFYPGRCLPQTFQAYNLVGLELPGSGITKLWEIGEREVLKKLRFLNISSSKLRTLDLGMTPNLESLNLKACYYLTDIHAPARCLKRLVYLNLLFCSKFGSSSFIKQLESLELLSLPKLEVKVEYRLEQKLSFICYYVEEQASSLENSRKSVSLNLRSGTKIESLFGSFIGLQHKRHLTFDGPIPELPNDLDLLANLEELNLLSTNIKCLPDSICMLKHLKSLKLMLCMCLEELPRDLGQLECLEMLIIICCESLKVIPNSICNMKRLKVLNIISTGIIHLPQSISLLEGLRIVGSIQLLQSCASATEIQISEGETFCYIQAVETGLESQFT